MTPTENVSDDDNSGGSNSNSNNGINNNNNGSSNSSNPHISSSDFFDLGMRRRAYHALQVAMSSCQKDTTTTATNPDSTHSQQQPLLACTDWNVQVSQHEQHEQHDQHDAHEHEQQPQQHGARVNQRELTLPDLNVSVQICRANGKLPLLCWDTETAGIHQPGICQLAYVHIDNNGQVHKYDKIWRLPQGIIMSNKATEIHGITASRSRNGVPPDDEICRFIKLLNEVQRMNGAVIGHNVSFDCRALNFTSEKLGLTTRITHEKMIDTMKLTTRHSPLKTITGKRKPFKNDELCTRRHRTDASPLPPRLSCFTASLFLSLSQLTYITYITHYTLHTRTHTHTHTRTDFHLHGQPPSWARLHNALDDVHVTLMNYQKGLCTGWW